jgi:hypothetical protein
MHYPICISAVHEPLALFSSYTDYRIEYNSIYYCSRGLCPALPLLSIANTYIVKKVSDFPVQSRDVTIPAGDGNIAKSSNSERSDVGFEA